MQAAYVTVGLGRNEMTTTVLRSRHRDGPPSLRVELNAENCPPCTDKNGEDKNYRGIGALRHEGYDVSELEQGGVNIVYILAKVD